MAVDRASPEVKLPDLPVKHNQFIDYISAQRDTPLRTLVEPYNQYDATMRQIFAQHPKHPAVDNASVVPVFNGQESGVTIHARDLTNETAEEKESYIMPLKTADRKSTGSPAIVRSLQEFRTNFNLFSESSLADLDWSNVVVAGSAVVTSLLAVPSKHAESKRALREYYHEQLAPASDVDLFLYGLTEEQAVEKIKQIERNIRDAILAETTTVRTKNAITIASQHPTRHVQIVLRIYKSISEILTGFDVDCSCAAFDGHQVYASPRALVAYMSQINAIDLTRRSPSYESRLSKYAHRGFEIYWPLLDRSKVDPTIFERSFGRLEGLARLLVLEKLPTSNDRDVYLDRRRAERGRPTINRWRMQSHRLNGNLKNDHEDEVAEWVESDEVSDYHTFTIPYGPKFTARRIEKLLYTKDLLLNAEWNRPKDREVHLHRHPAFFGRVDDILHDCCGYCPKPSTIEEEEAAEQEGKIYISGEIGFIKDDPGRQTIGSFNPLTAEDWTDMAYVGNTARLCQAIVDHDAEYVRIWLEQEGNDPNTRDYTGRTPLHLAVTDSTAEVVQYLIDGGARLVARLVDGKTALHLAAIRGSVDMVSALLRKSEANEEEEEKKVDARRKVRAASIQADVTVKEHDGSSTGDASEESDVDMVDADEASDDDSIDMETTTERSMVRIKAPPVQDDEGLAEKEDDEPDVYDVNVVAWDSVVSPLHLAIINGHTAVVKCLVQDFGADVLLPVKLLNDWDKSPRAAILTMVLALHLPTDKAEEMTRTLIELGATAAQADLTQHTTIDYCIATRADIFQSLARADEVGTGRVINHLTISGYQWSPTVTSPLLTAIRAHDSSTALQLLTMGAKAHVSYDAFVKACENSSVHNLQSQRAKSDFQKIVDQPIILAVENELPELAVQMLEVYHADENTVSKAGWNSVHDAYQRQHSKGSTLLDVVKEKLRVLKNWPSQEDEVKPPDALKDDSQYFSTYTEGSYAYWSIQRQLKTAKDTYNTRLKEYNEQLTKSQNMTGVREKDSAVRDLITKFDHLQSILLQKGAKTFAEVHPDIDKAYVSRPEIRSRYHTDNSKPFEVTFTFPQTSPTDGVVDRYMQLFQAAWEGDLEKVKELTLTPWKNSDGLDQAPMTIATQDQHEMTPLSIAILRGHFELATAIMQIAQAQYAPPEQLQNERYKLDTEEDEASESDENEIRIYKEIIDERFTVENIGEVSTLVKSNTTPLQMMLLKCEAAWDFVREQVPLGPRAKMIYPRRLLAYNAPFVPPSRFINLIMFAIQNDDLDLLTYLLSLGEEYTKTGAKDDDTDAVRFFSLDSHNFTEALQADRPYLTAELMKSTGSGIPLRQLVERSGVEIKEKPKYYQGLSVYGKKRQDWADAGRNVGNAPIEDHRPPILEAANRGALETVEWLLTDAPMRCYKEFAAANKDDKRLKWLSEAPGGFEASVSRFLHARDKLVIHCCIMGKPSLRAMQLLDLLVKRIPESIDAKSKEGITPLHIAFRNCRFEAAQILIKAGADQTRRDRMGRNILHHLLSVATKSEQLEAVQKMFELVDKRLISSLCTERSAEQPGAITPLAQWLSSQTTSLIGAPFRNDVLRTILRYSEGIELNMLNGEGHCPLHVCVRDSDLACAKTLLEHDPSLLMRENATGRTPFEMAEDATIAGVCKEPPSLPHSNDFSHARARILGLASDWHQSIVHRNAAGFVEEATADKRTDSAKLWDLLRHTRAQLEQQGQTKRRLVTLNEANEVARRLAESQHWMRINGSQPQDEEGDGDEDETKPADQDGADEVQLWLPQTGIVVADDEE